MGQMSASDQPPRTERSANTAPTTKDAKSPQIETASLVRCSTTTRSCVDHELERKRWTRDDYEMGISGWPPNYEPRTSNWFPDYDEQYKV
jgi:hypothetical protein